jgi:hypothetical protein
VQFVRVADRPPVGYERGPLTASLRLLGPAIALIGIVAMIIGYLGLPDTVPTHFGITGEADAYGPRWNVLVLAGVWALVQAMVSGLATHPRVFNYPVPVTAENAQRLYREGERMMVWLGLSLAVTFSGIALLTFGQPGGIPAGLGTAATVVVTIVGVVRCTKAGVRRA